MARIISFQDSLLMNIGCVRECRRRSGFTSINLETVRGMSSGLEGYPQKKVVANRSFWGQFWHGAYDFVDDNSRPIYRLTLQYKNHRQQDDTFYFDKEEFERVKAELARYGWKIF